MNSDRPPPWSLLDLVRDREDELTAITMRIIDAAVKDGAAEEMPADIQAATLAAAASLIVMTTPPGALQKRARDAEGQLRRLIHAHRRRADALGIDMTAMQSEGHANGVGRVFGDAWRDLAERRPIPPRWVEAGVGSPDHFRKILTAAALQEGMKALFERVFGEQAIDYAGATLAAIDASATVAGSLYDINQFDDEGFADMLVAEWRGTLLRTIAYWREKRGN